MNQEPMFSGFHALSDPIRLQIIDLLKSNESCVSDLCQALDIAQPRVSFHLKALKNAFLVTVRQQGRHMYYSLNESQFDVLERFLSEY